MTQSGFSVNIKRGLKSIKKLIESVVNEKNIEKATEYLQLFVSYHCLLEYGKIPIFFAM